jgi:exodeoxyribonuclease VII large subunit
VERRNPGLEIILAPCRVQGDGAAEEIAAAIRLLNAFSARSSQPLLDIILVTRGGGSLEDLWAFNEEIVARAIFESALPVVSAVGHEIDFTIGDFVADVRAATPSAAAEIITEGVFSSCQFLADVAGRMRQLARQQLADKTYVLRQAAQRLARFHPRHALEDRLQQLDDLETRLSRCANQGARRHRLAWRILADRLLRVQPAAALKRRREVLQQVQRQLVEKVRHEVKLRRHQLDTMTGRLRLLGPEHVLARGYSITTDAETGVVLRDAARVRPGQRLKTKLKAGEVLSRAEK